MFVPSDLLTNFPWKFIVLLMPAVASACGKSQETSDKIQKSTTGIITRSCNKPRKKEVRLLCLILNSLFFIPRFAITYANTRTRVYILVWEENAREVNVSQKMYTIAYSCI